MIAAQRARSVRLRDWSYGLALLGAHIAFMPLMVLLLPRRVAALAGDDASSALSLILLAGALVASLANIVAGLASDRWMRWAGNRRGPLGIGLALTLSSYVLLAGADSLTALTIAMVLLQLGVNAMLSPLVALLTDYFCDDEKGRISGIANAALPLSTATIAPLAWLFPRETGDAFVLTGVLAVGLCMPLFVLWPFPRSTVPVADQRASADEKDRSRRGDFTLAWIARFLVQLGAAFVLGYLYLLVAAQAGPANGDREAKVADSLATLAIAATVVAMLASLAYGRLSDKLGRRRWPLALSALAAGVALAVLAGLPGWPGFVIAYAAFHAGLAGFLAVDTALVAEMLTPHPRRAALLGVMNLTNTLPAVLAPGMTLLMLQSDLAVGVLTLAFRVCAAGCTFAAIAVLCMRGVR